MTPTGDALVLWMFGAVLIAMGLFVLFGKKRGSDEPKQYASTIFVLPALGMMAMGAFCIYQTIVEP